MSKEFKDTFDEDKTWHRPDGKLMTYKEVLDEITNYLKIDGAKVYVGSDSMLSNFGCTFATTICMHFNKGEVAKYYFQKERDKTLIYFDLQLKISREVNNAILLANSILKNIPESQNRIEIHADVGTSKKSETRKFVDFINGWVKGVGFECRVKPDAWASSIADWHTK